MIAAFNRHTVSWTDLAKRWAGRTGSGLNRVFGRRTRRPLGILVYHRVAPATPGAEFPSINVTPAAFREQLAGLKASGFRFLSLNEAIRRHRAHEMVEPRSVVVTFDDGFASVESFAWPILRDLQVPSTIFVNTAYLGSASAMPFDDWGRRHESVVAADHFRPLTMDECRAMRASGLVEIGTHTHTHEDFRGRPGDLAVDLRRSIQILADELGVQSPTFAFPFGRKSLGYVSAPLVEAARSAGAACSLTTEAETVDPSSDPFDWGRFNVYDWDTPRTLAGKLDGWYGWAPALQDRLAGRKAVTG